MENLIKKFENKISKLNLEIELATKKLDEDFIYNFSNGWASDKYMNMYMVNFINLWLEIANSDNQTKEKFVDGLNIEIKNITNILISGKYRGNSTNTSYNETFILNLEAKSKLIEFLTICVKNA